MLESVKIQRRQSEIRQSLAALAAKPQPSEDETRSMSDMDREYGVNETRLRAALIGEDGERRAAGAELETRGSSEWSNLVTGFELRQAALYLDEGRALTGATGEVVAELRNQGGFRGVPIPWEALETRAGETVAAGVASQTRTQPILDRIFAQSVAARMGVAFIGVDAGEAEIPVTTSNITAGWAATETGAVAGPTAYATTDRPMKPNNTLGVQVSVTRRALKTSGAALEAAIRRDLAGVMRVEMDKAVFMGTGADGQPAGVLNIAGITKTAVNAVPTYEAFLTEIKAFMVANAINNPGEIRTLFRPETFEIMERTVNATMQMTEYYRTAFLLAGRNPQGTFPENLITTASALPAPTGSPLAVPAILTTSTNGTPPLYVGAWGAIDMIRDPYADAASGGLRLTALATMDITYSRAEQTRVLTGLRFA